MEKIKPAPGYDKKRNYSDIVIGADSFLLRLDKKTKQYLDTKPSCLDGLTPEEEEDLRFLGAELIESIVHLLKLPMIVGETACIFFQRFYGVQSFVKYPIEVSFNSHLYSYESALFLLLALCDGIGFACDESRRSSQKSS